ADPAGTPDAGAGPTGTAYTGARPARAAYSDGSATETGTRKAGAAETSARKAATVETSAPKATASAAAAPAAAAIGFAREQRHSQASRYRKDEQTLHETLLVTTHNPNPQSRRRSPQTRDALRFDPSSRGSRAPQGCVGAPSDVHQGCRTKAARHRR